MSNLFEKLENRQVRFFISSTFLDLDEERNYLVKKVFPGIKKYCSDRDIEFTEVDLRWGITEDESRSGKIIQTCLREIDRAYPCFIGILKNRYGWVPEFEELDKNPQLTDQYSWVTDQVLKKRSITEIEFFYGALGYATLNKDKPNAFFYIDNSAERDSKTISGIKIDYPEDVHLLRQKLIAQKDFPVCRFNSIRSLEEKLTKDLESYIEKCFHKPVEKNLSEKLLDEHIRFAQSRQRVYIPNEQFYTILDEHFVDDSSPLIITGESGSGKTSLISNWLKRINKVHSELFMFFHFTGGATDSTDPMNFLYRLLHELKTKFNIPVEIPTDSSKYQETLNIFLNHQDIKAIRWLLVIDGINQMDDYSGKNSLDWFPMSFPVNIRVIISCLEGEILSRMESRGYTIRKINLLNNEDKEVLTLQYLKQYSKALDTPVLQKITSDPKTGNPLILRTLIDELRIFGSHINLTNHLDDYLNSETNEIFFQTFLQRLENDFLHENKELVKEILGLIAISRKGLSESEILAITKIKPLHWAQFYHSVESHLINRGGFLVFSHNFLKQAVGKKYFENSNYKQWLVGKITRYFEKNRSEKRSLIELPYQYENSEQWRNLKKFLGNAERFILLYDMDEVRLLSFWKKLREKYSMGDVYLSSFTEYVKTNPGKEKELILAKKLGKFLSSASCNHEALKLLNSALKLSSEINKRGSLETVEILNEIGEIYYQISENKKALVYYNRALSLVKKIGKENELIAAKCYENIAWIYDIEMKYSQALKFGELALKIKKDQVNVDEMEMGEINHILGDINYGMNRFEVAGKMLRDALRSRINFFGEINPKTASTYCQLAMLYDTTGNFPNAEKYYQKDLDISRKIFGELHSGSSDAYNNLGVFYFNQQNYSAALPVYKKALEIRRKILGEKNEDTAASHNNLGYNYLGQVLENYKDNIEDKDNLLLRKAYDYFQQAVKIRKEELRKTEENNLTESYIGFGLVQMHLGQIRRGSVYFNQGLILAKEFYPDKYNSEWANTLEIIGDNFRALKDFKKAEEYYSKSLKIRKKNFKPDHMFIQRVMEKLLKLNS